MGRHRRQWGEVSTFDLVRPQSFQRNFECFERSIGKCSWCVCQDAQNRRELHQTFPKETTCTGETSMCYLGFLGQCTWTTSISCRCKACHRESGCVVRCKELQKERKC